MSRKNVVNKPFFQKIKNTFSYKAKVAIHNIISDIKYELYKGLTGELPGWAKSRLYDDRGMIDFYPAGYGTEPAKRVLVISFRDPFTEYHKQGDMNFVIYFSFQESKPITPKQAKRIINTIYEKFVKPMRTKGLHVFPIFVAKSVTPGAMREFNKSDITVVTTLEDLKSWIIGKIINRMKKFVEKTKYITEKFQRLYTFFQTIIEGFGYRVPPDIVEAWAKKPLFAKTK